MRIAATSPNLGQHPNRFFTSDTSLRPSSPSTISNPYVVLEKIAFIHMNIIRPQHWAHALRALGRTSRPQTASRLSQNLLCRHPPTYSPVLSSISRRHLQQQAAPTAKSAQLPAAAPAKPAPAQDLGGDAVHVTQAEQRKKDWSIIKKLLINIWPPNDWGTKGRVILGFGLLISGKVHTWMPRVFHYMLI